MLTDGESTPFDPSALGRSLAGVGVVVVRLWNADESVYGANGRPETAYRPDPHAPAALDSLAQATGGSRAFDERDVGAAAGETAQRCSARGRRSPAVARTRRETPLAPFIALLALAAARATPGPARPPEEYD